MVGLGREFRQGGGRVHVPENLERARPCSLPYLQQQVVEYTYAACLYDHVRIGGASDHLAGGVYGCGIKTHLCPLGDRKSFVWGKSMSVRVDHGGRPIIKKKKIPRYQIIQTNR